MRGLEINKNTDGSPSAFPVRVRKPLGVLLDRVHRDGSSFSRQGTGLARGNPPAVQSGTDRVPPAR